LIIGRGSGPVATAARIVRADGVRGLYAGVSATVLRQCLYSTTRMGLYEVLKEKWAVSSKNKVR
jgi:solute carrier family 25 oxoglutarate transporter 11